MKAYYVSVQEVSTSTYRVAWNGDAESLREALNQGEISLDDMTDCDIHASEIIEIAERDNG
jgi:hypothetical protein